MALALYRRYRPDTFDGVIGQDQVTVPLMRALDEGKLTHAYLFSGPRGCGKTSSARILARCINCVNGPTSHPCGECESCKDLAVGGPGSIDVVEIDAASHNGVDDARELRERAGFAPARDRYKIFILDEAHMVTQQGFNALLKIVEEPPEHVMFIFATTEPDKVIGTIRSRTHHYPFRLIPQEIMGPYLEGVCEKEGIRPEPGVLRLAMRAGGGSMRDTLSVLDQLMVGAVDGAMTLDSAVALLGFTPDTLIGEAIDAVIDRNGEALYGVIQKVVVGGFDPRRFVEDLLARVRDLLVLTLGGERAESVLSDDAAAEDVNDLRRQASALGLPALTAIADIINDTLGSMTGAISPRMRLELLAARLLAGRENDFAVAQREASAGMPATTAAQSGDASTQQNPAVKRGGFIGSHAANSSIASSPATTPSVTVSEHTAANIADNTASDTAEAVPRPDNRTPDERWDALVAAMPPEVQRYINRTKVPRINLSPDPKSGQKRLWIKFDVPLSKYAFAMAATDEAINGSNKVQDIVRAAVRAEFGQDVALAPTQKMADGQVAPPLSKLSPQDMQRIKLQVLQQDLNAASSGMALGAALSGASSVGAASGVASTASAASSDDEDQWAVSSKQPEPRGFAAMHSAMSDLASDDDDPWAAPSASSGVSAVASSAAPAVQEPPHKKHVAVPDVSDDVDPWAQPLPTTNDGPAAGGIPSDDVVSHDAASNGVTVNGAADNVGGYGGAQQGHHHFHAVPAAANGSFAGGAANPGATAAADSWNQDSAAPVPQVAPEEDEYSMNDESLESATTMSVEDVAKMFEAKSVEDFAADDPKNPRNMKVKKNLES